VLCNACGTRFRRTGQLHQRVASESPAQRRAAGEFTLTVVKKQRLTLEECVMVRC
jgi:hypothetical protein